MIRRLSAEGVITAVEKRASTVPAYWISPSPSTTTARPARCLDPHPAPPPTTSPSPPRPSIRPSGPSRPGLVAEQRFRWEGLVDGEPVISAAVNWLMGEEHSERGGLREWRLSLTSRGQRRQGEIGRRFWRPGLEARRQTGRGPPGGRRRGARSPQPTQLRSAPRARRYSAIDCWLAWAESGSRPSTARSISTTGSAPTCGPAAPGACGPSLPIDTGHPAFPGLRQRWIIVRGVTRSI